MAEVIHILINIIAAIDNLKLLVDTYANDVYKEIVRDAIVLLGWIDPMLGSSCDRLEQWD